MIRLTTHEFKLHGLPSELDGLRAVQLTDLHRSHLTSDSVLKRAVAVAMECNPDIIFLTGDYVTASPADVDPCGHILAPLKASMGVFAVLGNHDYTTSASLVTTMLEKHDIKVLVNENVRLRGGLVIAGLEDDRYGKPDVARTLHGVKRDEAVVILAHNPIHVEKFADRPCLVLSGHTHGGQIHLPILTQREMRRIGAGRYRAGWYTAGKAAVYVNYGLGQVGLPVRFLCKPEVSLFTLRSGNLN